MQSCFGLRRDVRVETNHRRDPLRLLRAKLFATFGVNHDERDRRDNILLRSFAQRQHWRGSERHPSRANQKQTEPKPPPSAMASQSDTFATNRAFAGGTQEKY